MLLGFVATRNVTATESKYGQVARFSLLTLETNRSNPIRHQEYHNIVYYLRPNDTDLVSRLAYGYVQCDR